MAESQNQRIGEMSEEQRAFATGIDRPATDLGQPESREASAGAVSLTDEALDAKCELSIVRWEGRLHCAYLNDHRIAGGKPWGGGDTAKLWNVTLRDVIRAFPELQRALGFDYLGDRVTDPLASAAPDLLEALKEIFDGVDVEGIGPEDVLTLPLTGHEAMNALAAILKAETSLVEGGR